MPLTNTTKADAIPQSFLVLLYPCHQLLDSAGPLDILSTLTKLPQGANLTLTVAAETLDPIDLSPARPRCAAWEWEDVPELPRTADGDLSGAGFNLRLSVDVTFEQALKDLHATGGSVIVAGTPRPIDVVLIPGGIGSRMFRIYGPHDSSGGGTVVRQSNVASLLDFIQQLNAGDWVTCAWLTVCTGSDVLARTGLLRGRRATTNVRAFDAVRARNPAVRWLEKTRWVRSLPGEVELGPGPDSDGDGDDARIKREVWTGAGISAGMDLMLWFIAEVWGRVLARSIAQRIEYEWREGVEEGERDPFYG